MFYENRLKLKTFANTRYEKAIRKYYTFPLLRGKLSKTAFLFRVENKDYFSVKNKLLLSIFFYRKSYLVNFCNKKKRR